MSVTKTSPIKKPNPFFVRSALFLPTLLPKAIRVACCAPENGGQTAPNLLPSDGKLNPSRRLPNFSRGQAVKFLLQSKKIKDLQMQYICAKKNFHAQKAIGSRAIYDRYEKAYYAADTLEKQSSLNTEDLLALNKHRTDVANALNELRVLSVQYTAAKDALNSVTASYFKALSLNYKVEE